MQYLKIIIIADPFIPVPPINYGGIERIIDFLVAGLVDRGHEVILLAHKDSKVEAEFIAYDEQSTPFKHLKNILKVNQLKKFKPDIIHSFGRLAYLLPFLHQLVPKLMSYQRPPTINQIEKAILIARKNTLFFTGCSAYISDQITPYATSYPIFNGVEIRKYKFKKCVDVDAPLVFLGRIEPIKGTHIAIEVSKRAKRKLVIAGNIPKEHQAYFDNQIINQLDDNITYIGPVNDIEKDNLLGKASALLMPIEWDEPFGIVMAEAMACGTPTIGFNRGSVPEVVIDGYNGYRCETIDEMIKSVFKINNIDRGAVRKDAEERFSSEVITNQYLKLYYQLIAKGK